MAGRDVSFRGAHLSSLVAKWAAEEWWAAELGATGTTPAQKQQQQQQEGGEGSGCGTGGGGGAAAASSKGYPGSKGDPWAFLLPLAPHQADGLLPTCANPLCTEMQGDTEAAVELHVRGRGAGAAEVGTAGAGAGASSQQQAAAEATSSCYSRCYCCTACRTAHEQVLAECAALLEPRRRQLKLRADGRTVKRAVWEKLCAPLLGMWAVAQAAVGKHAVAW